MAEPLIQEITLQDKGFSEGVHSAQEELKQLGKENNNTGNTLKSLKSQFNSAKTEVGNLSARYHQLTEEQKNGNFGKALKAQLDEAKAHALQFRDTLDKIQDDLDQIKGKSKNLGKGMDIGGGFDLNKMISGTLRKAGFGEMASMAEGLGSAMGGGAAMGAAAMTAGVTAAGLAVKELIDVSKEAIQKSAEFGRSMSELGAITGVSGDALQQMRGQVMAVGKDTNTAFSEVSKNFQLIGGALPELLQDAAGLEEVSRNAITLHKAGLLPLEEATNSLTLAMAQFGLGAKDANMVVNSMAAGSKAGSAEIRDISEAMLNSGAAAKLAGVDFKDTTALIETMAKEGYKGADAGTKLRNVFLTMSTKGIDEINPKVVGLEQALENLKAKASDAAFMTETFGQANIGVASAIANNIDYFNEVRGALDELGVAEEMAVTNSNNLATQWDDMTTKWNNFLASFDLDNSPLTSIVQEIGAIIDAIDEAVHAIMETSVAQGAIAETAALWEVLGEAIRVVIQILGDVISTVMELTDITGDMSNKSDILTTELKVLKEVLWAIGATVKLLCNGIKWLIDEFHNLMKAAGEQVKDIPFLSTLYKMLIKVKDAIKWCIDAWKDFKKWVDSTDTVKAAADAVGKTKNGTHNGGSDTGTEGTQEKGIIKKLEDEVKRLKEARDNATTESEIKRYNNLIKQKQNELNKLTGTGNSGGSGGSGKKVTANDLATKAEKEYSDALAIIAAEKEFANKKELEAEEDNLKALEKLRDSYIKIPKKTNEHLRRLNEINNAIRRSANSIRVLQETERWADVQNNMFKDLSQSTRQLSDGFIDEKEWEQKRINSVKKAVEELYSLSTLNKEQEKALKSYINELNKFKIDEFNKKIDEKVEKLDKELAVAERKMVNVAEDRPQMNSASERALNLQIDVTKIIDAIDRLQNNESATSVDMWDYAKSEKFMKALEDMTIKIDTTGGAFRQALRNIIEELVKAGKVELADELEEELKDLNAGAAEIRKFVNENEELQNAMKELGIDFNKIKNEILRNGDGIGEALDVVKQKLEKYRADSNLDGGSSTFASGETVKRTKGDDSNYRLNHTSSEQLNKEMNLVINTVGMDKFDKLNAALDTNMQKYKELENAMVEYQRIADETGEELGGEFVAAGEEMDRLESVIRSDAAKIRKHLQFEVRMNNLQKVADGLQNLQSIASNMNFLSNLNDELENCDNGFEEFIVHLQAVISIINIIQGTIEAFNTVMSLVGLLFGKSAVAAGADAAAKGADATATGVQAAAEEAAVPGKIAEAAANKTLEASVLDLAAAQIFAAHASIPFVGVGLASGFVTAMMTAMTAQHTASLALQAMAEGGIIDGSAFHGDTTLIRANKGEMVLNTSQQRNLFDLLDHGAGFASALGDVNFKIQGDALVGTLKNHNKIKSKTGHTLKF